MNRRWLGPLLSVILIVGVGAALFVSIRNTLLNQQKITVSGLIGSEKEEFFRDERVQRALDRLGIEVRFEKAGSREIAQKLSNDAYDFGFPAGAPAAEKIRKDWNLSTPLVHKIRKRMPAEALAKVESIKTSIESILPILAASNLGDRNVFTIRQTVFEYLPTALENYLSLPPAFANLHPVRDGKTARQLLNEQLDLLDREMKEIVVDMSANDTQKLLAHGRFLEQKFNQADFLSDLLGKKPALAGAPTARP